MIKMEEKEMKKKTINEKLARVEQDRKMKLCIVRKMCSEGAKKNLLGLKRDRKSRLLISKTSTLKALGDGTTME